MTREDVSVLPSFEQLRQVVLCKCKLHDCQDLNDGQSTFGIMTNEPTFDWQLQAIQHLKWKEGLARTAETPELKPVPLFRS